MIIDKTNGKLADVKAFAATVGKLENLEGKLKYLGNYACNSGRVTRCHLMNDYAPQSFYFELEVKAESAPDSEYRLMMNGGLILHSPQDGWGVHT
jgi:hypothetical protein